MECRLYYVNEYNFDCTICITVTIICFVADGQDFIILSNQREYNVLLGDSVSLVCGSNLTSNSNSSIDFIWHSPIGNRIKPEDISEDYTLENGPDVARLNITNAAAGDDGLWNCTVTVSNSVQTTTIALHVEIQLTVLCE